MLMNELNCIDCYLYRICNVPEQRRFGQEIFLGVRLPIVFVLLDVSY